MCGEQITFLYTFTEGPCPMSFGLNVARMAGVNKRVLMNAKKMA